MTTKKCLHATGTSNSTNIVGKRLFQRERLPSPPVYFDSIGLKLIGKGAWRSALCPFHDDSRASLRVQYALGAFRCMACNARGGDVLAFERLRTGKSFAEAARDLGAWGQP